MTMFFDKTGRILGRTFSGSKKLIALNTPLDCTPIEGEYDPESQRVDVAALALAEPGDHSTPVDFVVDDPPPQPGADYEWDTTSRRWRKTAARAILEARDASARATIQAAESQQARVVRELLLALPNLPPAARARLQVIEDAIAVARADLIG